MKPRPFQELLQRVRDGDERAATELVRRYETEIRSYVRQRLNKDPKLARLFDSDDIWQSILRRLFPRLWAGSYQLDTPEDLAKLLTTMARNNLANKGKAQRAGKRDQRRTVPADTGKLAGLAGRELSPSQAASLKELLEKFPTKLSPFERFLAEQRRQARTWDEIAADVGRGVSADGLRKQLERAITRATE